MMSNPSTSKIIESDIDSDGYATENERILGKKTLPKTIKATKPKLISLLK